MKTRRLSKAKHQELLLQRKPPAPSTAGRGDHEVVNFRGRLIPVLGTVGGTKEQSRETAKNIERYFANRKSGAK